MTNSVGFNEINISPDNGKLDCSKDEDDCVFIIKQNTFEITF